MNNNIVVVDYGMGNLQSVRKKLIRLKASPLISSDAETIKTADKIILPGVGHLGKAMENIKKLQLKDALDEFALIKKRPILGICLGMQLMAESSEEGDSKGLGWFNGNVVKFKHELGSKFKNPHMGWNNIQIVKDSPLMKNISEQDEFYFVHSFYYLPKNKSDILNNTTYNYSFCSAIEKDNIFGVQYHPEKSHDCGETLFRNFLNL